MHTLFFREFFGFLRIAIPPLPYIGIHKHPKAALAETLSDIQKVSTRIIRVDTFNSSRLFTEWVKGQALT